MELWLGGLAILIGSALILFRGAYMRFVAEFARNVWRMDYDERRTRIGTLVTLGVGIVAVLWGIAVATRVLPLAP